MIVYLICLTISTMVIVVCATILVVIANKPTDVPPTPGVWVSAEDRRPTEEDAGLDGKVLAVPKHSGVSEPYGWKTVAVYSHLFDVWQSYPKWEG